MLRVLIPRETRATQWSVLEESVIEIDFWKYEDEIWATQVHFNVVKLTEFIFEVIFPLTSTPWVSGVLNVEIEFSTF